MAALVTAICCLTGDLRAADPNVPRFLTGRQASPGDAHPPDRWSATESVAWKTDVAGLGWSSPIVWNGRIYLTTCVNTSPDRKPRKGLYMEDLDATKYPKEMSIHSWKTLCLDLTTGKIVWEKVASEGIPSKPHHIKNTLASETPTTDGERLYVLFGNLGLFCYDLDGKLLWTSPIPARDTRYGWGTSMSPIVYGDRVYFADDNEVKSCLFALDKRTGKPVWKVDRKEKTNYSTPYIWENPDRTELVTSGINWVTSYDLSGNELWKIKGKSILSIPSPFARDGLLYVTSGHVLWGKHRIYAIRPGAKGDISPPDDDKDEKSTATPNDPIDDKAIDPHIAWYRKIGPYHPTPLIVGDNLYMLFDRGILMCFDAKTGKLVFNKQRLAKGNAFTSSPWSYGDKLFCLNEDGVTSVVQTGPEFKSLHTNTLAEDDMCMATPVIVGDKLLIRTSKRLYCVQNLAKRETTAKN
ncbi:MAG TPA: PQQ-binding-like beta-propeller repeat protein [Planctomycetaceae bacterium]|jgi:outer membrane protein assembly factor BamB|nr:PQQ-binding-like beta-propeller repeat protein [Planctomycetaceae bacterium]